MRRFVWPMIASFVLVAFTGAVAMRHAWASGGQDQKLTEIKIDPKIFDDYVGQYSLPTNPDVVLSFFREADKFYVQATNQGRIEIFPASESKFFLKLFDAQVDFVRDAQGNVTGIV